MELASWSSGSPITWKFPPKFTGTGTTNPVDLQTGRVKSPTCTPKTSPQEREADISAWKRATQRAIGALRQRKFRVVTRSGPVCRLHDSVNRLIWKIYYHSDPSRFSTVRP